MAGTYRIAWETNVESGHGDWTGTFDRVKETVDYLNSWEYKRGRAWQYDFESREYRLVRPPDIRYRVELVPETSE